MDLTLDPKKPGFTGAIDIALDVKKPFDVLWLNAADIAVAEASLTGRKDLDGEGITGQQRLPQASIRRNDSHRTD